MTIGAFASDVILDKLYLNYSPNEPFFYAYNIKADAAGLKVNSYTVEVRLDGEKVATNSSPALTTEFEQYTGQITLPALSRGKHTVSVTVTSVNGKEVEEGEPVLTKSFNYYLPEDVRERQKFLVEEFTSNSCTFCPDGADFIERMGKYSDKLAVVCVHGNMNGRDEYTISDGVTLANYLGLEGWPKASLNRIYFSESGICAGIVFEQYQRDEAAESFIKTMENYASPSFADVNISAFVEGNKLNIGVSGRGTTYSKTLLEDYNLTVYVLENGLIQRQLDNGNWISNYMHNRVLRKVVTPVNGDPINWTSDRAYSNTYTIDIEEGWKPEYMHIVAFLNKKQPLENPDREDMVVSNANSIKLYPDVPDPQPEKKEETEEEIISEDLGVTTPITESIQILAEKASPNGKFAVGINYASYAPAIWNTEEKTIFDFPEYERSTFHAVSNSGIAVGGLSLGTEDNLRPCYATWNGTIEQLDSKNNIGEAYDISENGIIVGYYYRNILVKEETKMVTTACYWKDGVLYTLPNPTKEQCGIAIDGAEARYVSSDGSVILGFVIDNYATWPAVIWRLNSETGEYVCDPIFAKYWEEEYGTGKPYMVFTPGGISSNGEWLSITAETSIDESTLTALPTSCAIKLNLNTNTLVQLDDVKGMSISALGIADNGAMVAIGSPAGVTPSLANRTAYVYPYNSTKALTIQESIGSDKSFGQVSGNTPASITSDGKKIMGFGITAKRDFFSYLVNLSKEVAAIDNIYAGNKTIDCRNNRVYNISGQQVGNVKTHGIYIINGKKVVK